MLSIPEAAMQESPVVFLILDRAGNIVFSTDHIPELLGYESCELIGTSCFNLLQLQNPARARAQYEKIIPLQGATVHAALQARHKAGYSVWLEFTVTNLLHLPQVQGMLITIGTSYGKSKPDEQKITRLLVSAQEKERRRIAAELHDNVNQMLVMSVVFLEMAIRREDKRDKLLPETVRHLKEAIEEIRKLSLSMSGAEIETQGLRHCISKLIQNIRSGISLRIVAKIDPLAELKLSAGRQLHLLRIVQEQVQNILKHAHATRVLISLALQGGTIVLKVKDNGQGFDTRNRQRGAGISNMMHRAKMLHGQIYIASGEGKGTLLTVRVPVVVSDLGSAE